MSELIDPKRMSVKSAYRLWTDERVRNTDTDMQRHVSNSVYAVYFEIGRGAMAPVLAMRPPGSYSIVARQVIHYHAELVYPATIRIGVAIARIGTRSYDVAHAVFDGDRCVASGEVAQVLFDSATSRSLVLPENFRNALAEYLLP